MKRTETEVKEMVAGLPSRLRDVTCHALSGKAARLADESVISTSSLYDKALSVIREATDGDDILEKQFIDNREALEKIAGSVLSRRRLHKMKIVTRRQERTRKEIDHFAELFNQWGR